MRPIVCIGGNKRRNAFLLSIVKVKAGPRCVPCVASGPGTHAVSLLVHPVRFAHLRIAISVSCGVVLQLIIAVLSSAFVRNENWLEGQQPRLRAVPTFPLN